MPSSTNKPTTTSAPTPTSAPAASRPTSDIPWGYFTTKDGQIIDSMGKAVRFIGVNWFGFETDVYVLHGLWMRSMQDMLDDIQNMGFNIIRVPFSSEMLHSNETELAINYSENPDLVGLTGLEILVVLTKKCSAMKPMMRVMVDHHSSNADGLLTEQLWYIPGENCEWTEVKWIED